MASGMEVGGHGPQGPKGDDGPAGPQGAPGSPATPSSWYVDSNSGSDANSGQYPSQAFATIAKLLQQTIATGQTIYLARGSKWKESIPVGSLPERVDVIAYGRGSRPLLDCSDVAANGSFSLVGGYTYTYQIAWTVPVSSAGDRHCVWEDGTRLVRATSVANCEATAGSFYAPRPATGGSDLVYVHASDSSNVVSNGKTYELAKRLNGLVGSQGGQIVGIHARRNAGSAGSILSYSYARDCLAEEGGTHNMWVEGTAEDCIAWGCEIPQTYGGATMFVTYPSQAGSVGARGVIYRRCRAIGTQAASTIGFYTHTDGSATSPRIYYEDCEVIGLQTGFAGTNLTDHVFRNCRTYRCVTGISSSASRYVVVMGGKFISGIGLTQAAMGMANAVMADQASAKIIMRGVRVIVGGNTNQGVVRAPIADIQRCTFAAVNKPVGEWYWAVYGDNATGRTLNFQRNIVYGFNTLVYLGSSGNTVTSDYNVLYQTAGTIPASQINGSTYTTMGTWQGAGYDAHSVNTDPAFSGQVQNGDCRTSLASPSYSMAAGADYEDEAMDQVQWDYAMKYGNTN